jgi:hypothetical protein
MLRAARRSEQPDGPYQASSAKSSPAHLPTAADRVGDCGQQKRRMSARQRTTSSQLSLCGAVPHSARPPRAGNRSIPLLEVSVWEPIGRVRQASASVNSGAGDTSLRRNAYGDARGLANWHPDCVSACRGPRAVSSGWARWFSIAGMPDILAGSRVVADSLRSLRGGRHGMTWAGDDDIDAMAVPGFGQVLVVYLQAMELRHQRTRRGQHVERSWARAAPRAPCNPGRALVAPRGVAGETAAARGADWAGSVREVPGRYARGPWRVYSRSATGTPRSYCSGRHSPVRGGVRARHES